VPVDAEESLAAFAITAYAWAPKAQPRPTAHRPASAITQHPAPAKPVMTVTVGKAAYACTAVPKAKPKR
jgi:hypothetical protein